MEERRAYLSWQEIKDKEQQERRDHAAAIIGNITGMDYCRECNTYKIKEEIIDNLCNDCIWSDEIDEDN